MSTTALAALGLKALEWKDAVDARKSAAHALEDAYRQWKADEGFDYVAKDTPEFDRMLADTRPQYLALDKTKAAERNAVGRMARAAVTLRKAEAQVARRGVLRVVGGLR